MPKQNNQEFLKRSPLDVDILWHGVRYQKNRFSSMMRHILKKTPALKMAWHYFYFKGRRRKFFRSLPPAPRKLKLELTNSCNLRCIMCPNSGAQRKRGKMEWDLFEKILHQAKEIQVPHIGMYSTGESMIHPQFCEMVSYAKKQGFYVSVCTNAQLLTEEVSRKLIESDLNLIRYSIEGSNPNRYESVRRGGKFERLLSNIRYFKKLRDEKKASTRIWIDSVYFGEGFEEAKRFKELFSPYTDGIFFYPVCNMGGSNDLASVISGEKRNGHPSPRPSPCINLWAILCLTWDGKATLCNYDFEAETTVGDVRTSTLKEIWHSKEMNHFRNLHLSGQQNEMPLCGSCSDIYSQPNAVSKPFLVDEKVVRPCLKTSFEAFLLNDQIEEYCRENKAAPITT